MQLPESFSTGPWELDTQERRAVQEGVFLALSKHLCVKGAGTKFIMGSAGVPVVQNSVLIAYTAKFPVIYIAILCLEYQFLNSPWN